MLTKIPFQYSVTIDDVVFNLEKVTKEQPVSLFDNAFFGQLKNLNTLYGTKFLLSLFYKTSASNNIGDVNWTLASMTAAYKSEFEANATWLKMGLHAWEYETQYYNVRNINDDLAIVKNEVVRFAGINSWTEKEVVIHYAQGNKDQLYKILQLNGNDKMVLNTGAYELPPYSRYHLNGLQIAKLNDKKLINDGRITFITAYYVERILGLSATEYPVYTSVKTRLEEISHRVVKVSSHEQYFTPEHAWYSAAVVSGLSETAVWGAENGRVSKHLDTDLTNWNWL